MLLCILRNTPTFGSSSSTRTYLNLLTYRTRRGNMWSRSTSISTVKSENATMVPSKYLPVAVFVGGTSGIGHGVAQALAKYTKGNAHIVLIGRNQQSAEKIISTFPKPTSPHAKHEFVQCDVTLMSNVHTVTSSLLSTLPKINYLVMSPGVLTMKGRDETSEGIDKKLACHYYARFAFLYDLLPLLKKADDAGEDSRAYSVFSAGGGGKIDLNDLGLKKTYTLGNAALQAKLYNDAILEKFSESNKHRPMMTFSHSFPGLVNTNFAKKSDSKVVNAMAPLMTVFSPLITSIETAGEYQLYGLLKYKGGFHRVGSRGDDIGSSAFSADEKQKLWEHSLKECGIRESHPGMGAYQSP